MKILPILLATAIIVSATPAYASNDKSKGKSDDDKGRGNSSVTFTTSSDDDSRIKTLFNRNILKIQEVGPSKLKSTVSLKYKLHEGSDDFKIKVPKGTPTANYQAFVTAVKQAYESYKAAIKTARENFMTAIVTARTTYLTPTTTPNVAPTVSSTAAAVMLNNTSASLSVLGADDKGEANLTYTWSAAALPTTSTLAPTFSVNGTNSAKNTVVTFKAAGTYQLQVVISDGSLAAVSAVTVTVNQVLTTVSVSPASIVVSANSSTQFSASAFDQFNTAQTSSFTWSVVEPLGGTISTTGLYTAPTATGTYHVVGSAGGKSATSTVGVN